MIDWDKFGPPNSPAPSSSPTSVPVAPAVPGGVPSIPTFTPGQAPTAPGATPIPAQNSKLYNPNLTQQQVDAMDPGARVARGIDNLGSMLFGQHNGSALGGLPGANVLADAFGGAGDALHNAGSAAVKPIEWGAWGLSHVPLGWLPGGADDTFNQLGAWAKVNDPKQYETWQKVNAAAAGDPLGGGNLKADFNVEYTKFLDDQKYESDLGTSPIIAMGRAGAGSLGGYLSNAIQGFLGLASGESQKALGNAGVFDPSGAILGRNRSFEQAQQDFIKGMSVDDDAKYALTQLASGKFTEQQAKDYYAKTEGGHRSRLQEIADRLGRGGEVSDVEKQAVEAWQSGKWSADHASTWLVSHGQGITRNPLGQAVGTVVTDPLTWATLGVGGIAKAGAEGTVLLRGAGAARDVSLAEKLGVASSMESRYQQLAATVGALQESSLGPAFRISRGLIDPLGVFKPSTVDRAVTNLQSATAITAYGRAHGIQAVDRVRAIGREFDKEYQFDSAIASYSMDKSNELIAQQAVKDALDRGKYDPALIEDFVRTHPDEEIASLAQNASRDAVTDTTDYMQKIAKNTFTAEEDKNLIGRMVTTVGGDLKMWKNRLSKMAFEDRSALHNITYKLAETDFEHARALIDEANYAGDLPLRNLVLMSAETLDDQTAEGIIDSIRTMLKSNEPDKIAAATAEWNGQAMRFPVMDNLGHAPGGADQLNKLVDGLEDQLKSGGITRRALDDELNDPALRSIRDFLDRHTIPSHLQQPLYHGSPNAGLASASAGTVDRQFDNATSQFGAFLTPNRAEAARYAGAEGKVYEAVNAPTNPYVMTRKEFNYFQSIEKDAAGKTIPAEQWAARGEELKQEAIALRQKLEAEGFDGIKVPGSSKGAVAEVASFKDVPLQPEGARRLWKIGFRPDEEVAWGLKRDKLTGAWKADRAPTISHVVDAVPGRQRFADTSRNVLGQIIGKSAAEHVNGPIDSIEAYLRTATDGVTGQRLVNNMARRFERSTFDAGIPKSVSSAIWEKAREVAAFDHTTVRGIKPENLWQAIANEQDNLIPRNLVLKDGTTVNVHVIMDHLLQAAEGDFRVMGVTSGLSQRMRVALRDAGIDTQNTAGQLTVTQYNKMRYAFNPMFIIQRITDAPYYSTLYGIVPVGKAALAGSKQELRNILDNLARTSLARDFSMDMPEYATRSNFTAGIKTRMQQVGLKDSALERINRAPDAIIENQMVNMLHARMGDIVEGSLDNLAAAIEKDPALAAAKLAATEQFNTAWGDIIRQYSQNEGRLLSRDEVAVKYVQDMLAGWRRSPMAEDGSLDFSQLIHEGERSMPNSAADIQPLRPAELAREMGYPDEIAMRRDVMGQMKKVNGQFQHVPGESDIRSFEEDMLTKLNVHPDYAKRAVAYIGDTWDDFWYRMSRSVENGGLDISPHYAKEAQDLIAREAAKRGMNPWEYLSGVMVTNSGADLQTAMGRLVGFLKSSTADQPLEAWATQFRMTLDPSAQETLLRSFEQGNASKELIDSMSGITPSPFSETIPRSAPGRPARPAVAGLPKNFTKDEGYFYRVDTMEKSRSGWSRTGVSTDPNTFYFGKTPGETDAVFRVKLSESEVDTGRHGLGGTDRLTRDFLPPEKIEVLTDNGWVPLNADPISIVMSKDFPEAIRQRMLSGVAHENPEVEGYMQAFSQFVKDNIPASALEQHTRAELRQLVEAVPTDQAVHYNRTAYLLTSLLKNKIETAQKDVFRLAEMQTKRTVLERSLNHPLFGLYPASYMWGKVLPETIKFIAKNPYAATYVIADVQRAIAIQREYDREMDDVIGGVDRSSGAFLLDYLTPGLPWSDHEARTSPLVRDIFKGKAPVDIAADEFDTMSPSRWYQQIANTGPEISGLFDNLQSHGQSSAAPAWASALQNLPAGAAVAPAGTAAPQITGPVNASGLAPILKNDLDRLSSILLEGKSAEE